MRQHSLRLAIVFALLLAPTPSAVSHNSDVLLDHTSRMSVRHDGVTWNGGGFCGQGGTDRYRVYIAFRLPEGAEKATALMLNLQIPGYVGPDPFETIDVFAIEGVVTPGQAFYDDLGSGINYGTGTTSRYGAVGTPLHIKLSAAAVEEFNRIVSTPWYDYYTGQFRVGLAIREPFTLSPGDEGVSCGPTQLVITPVNVPVESTTWGGVKALYQTRQ